MSEIESFLSERTWDKASYREMYQTSYSPLSELLGVLELVLDFSSMLPGTRIVYEHDRHAFRGFFLRCVSRDSVMLAYTRAANPKTTTKLIAKTRMYSIKKAAQHLTPSAHANPPADVLLPAAVDVAPGAHANPPADVLLPAVVDVAPGAHANPPADVLLPAVVDVAPGAHANPPADVLLPAVVDVAPGAHDFLMLEESYALEDESEEEARKPVTKTSAPKGKTTRKAVYASSSESSGEECLFSEDEEEDKEEPVRPLKRKRSSTPSNEDELSDFLNRVCRAVFPFKEKGEFGEILHTLLAGCGAIEVYTVEMLQDMFHSKDPVIAESLLGVFGKGGIRFKLMKEFGMGGTGIAEAKGGTGIAEAKKGTKHEPPKNRKTALVLPKQDQMAADIMTVVFAETGTKALTISDHASHLAFLANVAPWYSKDFEDWDSALPRIRGARYRVKKAIHSLQSFKGYMLFDNFNPVQKEELVESGIQALKASKAISGEVLTKLVRVLKERLEDDAL